MSKPSPSPVSDPVMPLPRRDMTSRPPEALSALFAELEAVGCAIPLTQLAALVERVPVTPEQLGDAIQIDGGAYVRTLVFERADVEVFVMAWLPGQRSPIHDHGGSACAVRVVSGAALERLYRKRDDGLVVATGERLLTGGRVTSSFDDDIHSFGNAVDAPASVRDILVTIHAYSPPLSPTHKYVEAAP
jgi:cysteine dioxygenase